MTIAIGTQIEFDHGGQRRRGRIVGLEPSRYRHGFQRNGFVAVVRPHGEREPLEVYIPHDASGVTVCDRDGGFNP